MKITRKTATRILKAIAFARTTFFVLFFVFLSLSVCSGDAESLVFCFVCFGISVICIGISYGLDWLLFELSYKN